jgi:hypothetical protein
MDTTSDRRQNTGVPEGYVAIPVSQADQAAPLRVCVLARQLPDPAAGQLILLRDLHDARVYLGCVADADRRVREWIEIWVQNVDGLEAALPSHREAFSNHVLDERWKAQAQAFRELNPAAYLASGWESAHPLPAWLDLSTVSAVHPVSNDTGAPWALCQDDRALQAAGLPPYSTSLARYLCQPSTGSGPFIPVTFGAPENGATAPVAAALAGSIQHLALNPEGGLMMAMQLSPVGLEDYADLLGGKAWPGIEHGKKRLHLDGVYAGLTNWSQAQQDTSHFFLNLQGKVGRFVETYHLKLQLLVDVFRQVRGFVQRRQLPFLNLTPDSFRVSLQPVGAGLPVLWTARCALVKPGNAFALPVESSDLNYFIRTRGAAASIYLPEGLSANLAGFGSVRVRKVMPPDQGRTILEGTLVMSEPMQVSPHDLLWMRLPLPSGRLDLYGHLYAAESMAAGEIRFRTIPQKFNDASLGAVRAAEGVSFARSPFEVVPLLSSPCDLYSLGVLAVRLLLVDEQTTLAIALDEVLSLARQVKEEHQPDVPLGARIRAIVERDPRYAASLGPHRLTREGLAPEAAMGLLPAELWYDTLAAIVCLFPGIGPDSVCRDFGDVPSLALETVFNRPLEQWEKLLIRSRSLIVIDWSFNREIHEALEKLLDRG